MGTKARLVLSAGPAPGASRTSRWQIISPFARLSTYSREPLTTATTSPLASRRRAGVVGLSDLLRPQRLAGFGVDGVQHRGVGLGVDHSFAEGQVADPRPAPIEFHLGKPGARQAALDQRGLGDQLAVRRPERAGHAQCNRQRRRKTKKQSATCLVVLAG